MMNPEKSPDSNQQVTLGKWDAAQTLNIVGMGIKDFSFEDVNDQGINCLEVADIQFKDSDGDFNSSVLKLETTHSNYSTESFQDIIDETHEDHDRPNPILHRIQSLNPKSSDQSFKSCSNTSSRIFQSQLSRCFIMYPLFLMVSFTITSSLAYG